MKVLTWIGIVIGVLTLIGLLGVVVTTLMAFPFETLSAIFECLLYSW